MGKRFFFRHQGILIEAYEFLMDFVAKHTSDKFCLIDNVNTSIIFISAIASLLISKRYYDKANRESVLMTVIFPIVKLLNQRYYTRKDYEALF